MTEVMARRQFSPGYIWFDIGFLLLFAGLLLWMSMSYGFTNFTWIWLWLNKDKHLFEWSVLRFQSR